MACNNSCTSRNHAEMSSSPGVVTYGTRYGFGTNGRLHRSRHVSLFRSIP